MYTQRGLDQYTIDTSSFGLGYIPKAFHWVFRLIVNCLFLLRFCGFWVIIQGMSDPDKQPIPIEKIKSLVYDVIVHNFHVDKGTLNESTDLKADIKADAKSEADFKHEIERVFGITIKDSEKQTLTSAGKIISFIENIFNN
jgi:acyl carrier protein